MSDDREEMMEEEPMPEEPSAGEPMHAGREPAPADATRSPLTRRLALKVLGAAPFVATAALAQSGQQQTRQTHEQPNQPARSTRQPASAPAPRFLTARERRTVRVLADDIIPRDERSGSASEAGVVEFIDFHLSVPETTDETRVQWRGGLRWLDGETRRRFGVAYAAATAAQRHAILDDISLPDGVPAGVPFGGVPPALRAGAAFFARARDMVASGFFSSAEGHRDLRYIGNVFVPEWTGCPEAALRKLGVSHDLMDARPAPGRDR